MLRKIILVMALLMSLPLLAGCDLIFPFDDEGYYSDHERGDHDRNSEHERRYEHDD